MKTPSKLLNTVRQCLAEPTCSIRENFSFTKSLIHYNKWVKQWESWNRKQNRAVKKEEYSFEFTSLAELWLLSVQAHNMYTNLKKEDFNKWVDWYMCWQNIVIVWYRLKTFEEWLHDGLKDALIMARDCPEDWARKIIERELGEWNYTNTMIHMFAEWKLDEETLKRLGQYEKYQFIEWIDIEKAIDYCIDPKNRKDVEVLTLKM